jgi:hypothetical protein
MRRALALLPVLIAFQAGAPPALAWTWPADGPVLRPFVFGDDPYAGGQHRGIDVAGLADAPVRAPSAGVVSFAGTVPGRGRAVTVRTPDGYSVTLVHLGAISVGRGVAVAEGAPLGTIGPTGDVEHPEPYVHLGVRVTSDPNGYLDPLTFLPVREVVPPPPPPAPPAAPAPPAPANPVAPIPEPVAEPAPVSETAPPPPAAAGPAALPAVQRAVEAGAPSAGEARTTDGAGEPASLVAPSGEVPAGRQPRTAPRSFEIASEPRAPARQALSAESPAPRSTRAGAGLVAALSAVAAAFLALAGVVAALAIRRRQLGDAGAAHAPAHVLDERAGRAAEDTGVARPAEEDGLVLDRDLERVPLGESEALADLDRDDDPAELIQVADDACRRLCAPAASGRFHQARPRVPSRCGRAETVSVR